MNKIGVNVLSYLLITHKYHIIRNVIVINTKFYRIMPIGYPILTIIINETSNHHRKVSHKTLAR